MTRLALSPSDRLHMLVWRSTRKPLLHWCTAAAVNGTPIESATWHDTWREAMDYAFERVKS